MEVMTETTWLNVEFPAPRYNMQVKAWRCVSKLCVCRARKF